MAKTVLIAYSENEIDNILNRFVDKLRNSEKIDLESVLPEEDRLTQKQAAAFLNRTVATLISYKKKNLPFYKIQGTIFYSKKELLEFARKNPHIIK